MDNVSLIILLCILVMFSAFFSATETAFSSVNKIRLKSMAESNPKAKKVLELEEDFDQLLSTILVGNNIVNIASASLATVLFTNNFGDSGVALSTLVMTVVVLIFGEISPKSIAKESPEQFCLLVVGPISFFKVLLKPVNWIFSKWKLILARFLSLDNEDTMTSEELIMLVEEAQNDGDFEEHETDLITAAIEFNDLDVKEILTPRVDVVAINVNESLEEIEKLFSTSNFSRFPVFENNIDNIIGVLHEKDFNCLYYKNQVGNLKSILKDVQFTSSHVKISNLLRQLQNEKTHMAVVIDEYGGTAGIITMEDILEELVGEIYDEHDEIIEYFKQISENCWEISCDADLEDMFEYFELDLKEDYDFNTVGGWVVHEMEKIPALYESFTYADFEIVVIECDGRHVEKVKVCKLELADEK